jgi:hypothetical protein
MSKEKLRSIFPLICAEAGNNLVVGETFEKAREICANNSAVLAGQRTKLIAPALTTASIF